MEQDSEHQEQNKKWKGKAIDAADRFSTTDGREQTQLPSLNFTLLGEEDLSGNVYSGDQHTSPHSERITQGRRPQLSASDNFRPHSVGPDQRRQSVHSKLSVATTSGLLDPGSINNLRQHSEGRRRTSLSGPPPDPNMEDPALTYPLSLTRSRNSVVGSSARSSFGYADFIPQEQPGFFDLASSGSNNKRTKPLRSPSDVGHRQDQPGNINPSFSISSQSISISSESINSTNSVPFAPPPPPPPSFWRKFRNQLSDRVLKRHFRFMAALYLSSSMTLIRPVANFLGPMPFLANTIVVFIHPARTVGSQLEVTLFSVIGAILATAWIIPCQLSVAAYNRQFFAKHGTLQADGHISWLIEAVWFFLGIWIMTTLKARYAKLTCTSLFFTIANIFGYNRTNDNVNFNIHAYWNLLGPMLIGVGVCLVVSIVFWPETASEGLGRALNESLDTSRALLNLSTRSFLLNHKTIALPKSVMENAQKEVRDAQKKLFTAYREARYEVTYATTDPADYKEVRVVVSALMRHLGSMSLVVQNERLLMLGHPDRENDDLETDSEEEESDMEGSDESSSGGDSSADNTDKDTEAGQDEGSTSRMSTASDCMGGGRRGSGPRKHKRGSAAELRRIRQLLMRAEMSTDAVLQARKAQGEGERQGGARPHSLGSAVLGSGTAPPTPVGSGVGSEVGSRWRASIFENYSLTRFSTISGGFAESANSPGTRRNTTPIVRSSIPSSTPTHNAQQSRRTSSLEGDHSDTHLEGFITIRPEISTATFSNEPSHGKDDHRLKLQGSGTLEVLSLTSGADMVLGTSPISGLSSFPSAKEGPKSHSDGGVGVRPSTEEFLENLPSRHSISGSFSVHKIAGASRAYRKEIKGASKRAEREAKKEQKRQQEEEARDVPPKEVAFGDRKLFLSFLDVVRDPLQRLSDSCSRSMVTMERELVIGLNVEKDVKERLRKRNSHRDGIVRRAESTTAEGNPLRRTTSSSISDLHPSTEDVSNSSGSKQPRQSLWQRVHFRIGVFSYPLTQGELDFMDVVRNSRDKERKRRASKSGLPADGIHPRKLQQHSTVAESLGDCMEEVEGGSTLPGDMSYVQYLTQELEIFDQAEANGLRGFIASHPALDVGPREEIFLVFFYIFALREIARELLRLGNHLEGMKRKQEVQMELDGRKKPRRRLWWPKVIGNFDHWFSWGSYSQTRASEGFSGMVMRSTKNLERRQPRHFAEERAHVAAKAAKAAEQEAKRVAMGNARREEIERRDRLRQRRNSESWDAPKPRRSFTMSALVSRPTGLPENLERGGDTARLAPQPGRLAPLSSRLARVRPWTFLSPRNKATGNPADAPQGNIPVHPLSTDTSRNATEAPGYQDGSRTGRAESNLQGQYTVVDIPEFQSLHRGPSDGRNSSNMHPTSAFSPMMNSIQSHLTAPPDDPLDADDTLKRNSEPPSSLQHRPSQVPLLKVTYDGQSDDNDDSEDSSFEQELEMGYREQRPRKRIQSAFAEVPRRYFGQDSGLGEEPNEKHRYRAPTSVPAPTLPPPPPAFVNTPKPKSMRYRVWEFLQEFKSDEVRYGLKMASALTFVGLWAWLGWTYTLLATDRGQWVMMTILAVLSPTIGATFSVCAWRVGGTLAGILWAMLTYLAYPRNPFVIMAMMSVITFTVAYCILVSTHPTMGVIMMISYNSIVFGLYHGRTQDNIYQTCYKVAITMIIGILISVALNTFLWPVLARRELRREIALLIGRQGVLFAELVNKYLLEEPVPREGQQLDGLDNVNTENNSDRYSKDKDGVGWTAEDEKSSDKESLQPSSMGSKLVTGSGRTVSRRRYLADSSHRQDEDLLDRESHRNNDEYTLDADQLAFQHVEHQLQTKLIKICQLLDLSASEPRLKEDFPGKLYKQIVQCCQNILDRMVSMRMAAQLLSTEVRCLVTGPMNYYRRDMVGALLLYFSVLSSSLASKTALPPYLPSARMARLRVIYNVRQAIAAHQAETGEDHYTYIYYYAFSSALEEVIEELELLAILIKPLVGVTLVSSSEGRPCGVSADQLSLGSAIPPLQMPVAPLQPGGGADAVIFADDGSDLRLGLGTGIMQTPGLGSGIFTMSNNTSEQAQLEQQLRVQQIELQRQQLQGVHPGLVLPNEASSLPMKGIPSGSEATYLASLPQQRQQQRQQRYSDYLSGPKVFPILPQPVASAQSSFLDSPVVIMNPMLLDNRHTQRFKDATELANEVSSVESPSTPVSSTTMSRSASLKKKISERIKNSPLIKDVFSPGGHHRHVVDAHGSSMSPRILPQWSQGTIDTKAEGSVPTKDHSSPRHGLGLALSGASIDQAEDAPSLPVHPPHEEVHPFDVK